jgi:hypothetical protein
MDPRSTLWAFDSFLNARHLTLEAVVIGGTALNLLGVISRQTRDCDVLVPTLSDEMLSAARAFAEEQRSMGSPLGEDWLNNGPASLVKNLPGGWEGRLRPLLSGKALTLQSLGQSDLLKTKLFAYCDRRTDLADCLALAPTAGDLADALAWVQQQDTNDLWPDYVRQMFDALSKRLGHGI